MDILVLISLPFLRRGTPSYHIIVIYPVYNHICDQLRNVAETQRQVVIELKSNKHHNNAILGHTRLQVMDNIDGFFSPEIPNPRE